MHKQSDSRACTRLSVGSLDAFDLQLNSMKNHRLKCI